jgi:hypothetical protein
MAGIAPVCIGLFFLMAAACAAETGRDNAGASATQTSPTKLSAEAEAKYGEYLGEFKGDRKLATEKTAEFLRTHPLVKKATVRGSDSILIIMQDGSELLLMLGKNRL